MNDGVIKEEVIEEICNFTFKNGEYVVVKQEEIKRKPENLLEQEIKKEPIDFFEDVERKLKENDFKIEHVFEEITERMCNICQKRMPRSLLKLIKSEEDKTVIFENFNAEGVLETRMFYVCLSHIQTIIDDNDGKFKRARNRFERLMRSFITKNKANMKERKLRRRNCHVCHMSRNHSEFYVISSKNIRMVIMIGCILRGTHSVEQAKSYTANNAKFTCYSHCKQSIDIIFEHLGVKKIEEFPKYAKFATGDLVDNLKKIDPNFTVDQFISAFNALFLKNQKFESSL
ncbi:unnamed protein product [Caenorhabditis nigoni]